MKAIFKLDDNRMGIQEFDIWVVISEPGDGTKYEYLVYYNGYEFFFMNRVDSFSYPKVIKNYAIERAGDVSVHAVQYGKTSQAFKQLQRADGANPFTVAECIRTAREMMIVDNPIDEDYNNTKHKE